MLCNADESNLSWYLRAIISEQEQNAEQVSDQKLKSIMAAIHTQCVEAADKYGYPGNYVMGANIAGFVKVADSMLAQGVV